MAKVAEAERLQERSRRHSFAIRPVVEMNLHVDGMLPFAKKAPARDFVCRHVLSLTSPI
jgi:hypothetical protein